MFAWHPSKPYHRFVDFKSLSLARIAFRNLLYSSDGTAFEKVFTEIMQYRHPGFIQVKPYGNIGDRSNDGFIPDDGVYFQVFAPENINKTKTVADAVAKADDDFQGLFKHWQSIYPAGITDFYFVVNDKFYGVPEPVLTKVEEIRRKYGLKKASVMTSKQLELEMMQCTDDEILSVVKFLPNPEELTMPNYDDISQVVGFILNNKPSRVSAFRVTPPDFEKKIQFNNLSIGDRLLREAEYLISTIEQYFEDTGGSFQKINIQNRMKELYEESKLVDFESEQGLTENDFRFLHILNQINPGVRGQKNFSDLEAASIGMMAVFFETCHIFEDPIKVTTLIEVGGENVSS